MMKEFSLIGPQVLSESMMECGFHYKDDISRRIKSIRANAAEARDNLNQVLRSQNQEAVMLARGHNNTISIMGSRGSGKTSVIMTLHRYLSGDVPLQTEPVDFGTNNIIMPILVPQDIAPGQTLLSWVVSQLLKKAEQIEEELNGLYGGMPQRIWQQWETPQRKGCIMDPFRECMDALLTAFDLRFQNGASKPVFQSVESDHIYYYMDSVKRDADLLLNMLKLISMMMDYYRQKECTFPRTDYQYNSDAKSPHSTEPLLFFTIDDLDLAPERSNEAMNLILRYLQHPNVVIICGWNHELFQNHLCMDLLRNQDVLESNQLGTNFSFDDVFMERYRKRTTALDSARRLASDNLKKAFPPAQRYEIRSLSIHERASFPFGRKYTGKDAKDPHIHTRCLFELIEEVVKQYIPESDKKKNFLRDDREHELWVYMRIFDNKARGLTNVYRAFDALLKNALEGTEDVTTQIRVLFDTMLFSNTRFTPYRRGIRDLVQIKKVIRPTEKGPGKLEYYCNFASVMKTLENYENEEKRKLSIEEAGNFPFDAGDYIEQKYDYFPNLLIDVFLLLNFMENFLRCITQQRRSIHGGREFSSLLNRLYEPIDFFARPQDLLTQAVISCGIEQLKLFPDTDNFALIISVLNAHECNGFGTSQYCYTGFQSLLQLFKIVNDLLPDEPDKPKDPDKPEEPESQELTDQRSRAIMGEDPAWFGTIIKLFIAMRPRKENVMRLAVYSSLIKSTNGARDTAKAAAEQAAQDDHVFENRVLENTLYPEDPLLSDDSIDVLVGCLRTIDNNRSRFNLCIHRGTLGHNTKLSAEDRTAYFRAKAFCEFVEIWGQKDSDTTDPFQIMIKNPFEFRDDLEILRSFKNPDPTTELNDASPMDTVSNALEQADRYVHFLLHNIDLRMRIAIQQNFQKANSPENKFEYLTWAATVVWKYMKRWELTSGSWGNRDIRAGSELLSIFQRNRLEAQANTTLNILSLGQDLERRGRDQYKSQLEELQQWVSSQGVYLTASEQRRIREYLAVLSEAPERIRRGLKIEKHIYDMLMGIGRLVSREFGLISWEIFESSKEAPEKRLTVWPVRESYDEDMSVLEKKLNMQPPKNDTKKSTLFDMPSSALPLSISEE